jgi:hypothetical protein
MVTTGIQNLPEPPARAEAAYRDPAAQLAPVSRDRPARRVGHFASPVQFVLDEPDSTRRMHDLTRDLRTVSWLSALLAQVLRGAVALVGGDFGNIQILDPATGSLRLLTQAGFVPELCEYFTVVDDGHSACAQAARQCAKTAIADVRTDPGFAPHREIAAAAGFRGARDLRIMELYADFAGEAVTRQLGRPSGEDPADPVGRAMVSALLDSARVREANVSVPFELWVMGRATASFARQAGRRGPDRNGLRAEPISRGLLASP